MRTIGIIGGGAAGIVAAIYAKRAHPENCITILEQKAFPGKKILVTGNGRCNITNEYMTEDAFRSDELALANEILSGYSYENVLDFFHSLGILTKSRNGYLYPRTDQAATIRDGLEAELHRLGVKLENDCFVKDIRKENEQFLVTVTDGNGQPKKEFCFQKLLLANGGKAAPAQGSDGSGYKLAKMLGHHTTSIVPALVALKTKEASLSKASGVRTNGSISIFIDGKKVSTDEGELQITAYGISGIPVFQVSRYAAKGLFEHKTVTASIDFVPEYTWNYFQDYLINVSSIRADESIQQMMYGVFPKKLADCLLKSMSKINSDKTLGSLDTKQIKYLVKQCKDFPLTIIDTNGFKNAQVCAGGVSLKEIHADTMESKLVPNLYFAGEILDVDGICGGYNLHFAWITGMKAGEQL